MLHDTRQASGGQKLSTVCFRDPKGTSTCFSPTSLSLHSTRSYFVPGLVSVSHVHPPASCPASSSAVPPFYVSQSICGYDTHDSDVTPCRNHLQPSCETSTGGLHLQAFSQTSYTGLIPVRVKPKARLDVTLGYFTTGDAAGLKGFIRTARENRYG